MKILIALLCVVSLNAKWKSLKDIKAYSPTSFTLKKGVAYVELRSLITSKSNHSKIKRSLNINAKMYRKPLSSYGSDATKRFRNLPMSKSKRNIIKQGSWSTEGSYGSWFCNGFMLTNDKKTWRLENKKDVVEIMKPVNTEAELSLIMWLYGHSGKFKYKKNSHGYTVIEHYSKEQDSCADVTYRYNITSLGVVTKKLLKKRAYSCAGAD